MIQSGEVGALRRAVRPDKLTLAALGATLRLYREAPDLPAALPVLRWLTRPLDAMERMGQAIVPELARRLGADHTVDAGSLRISISGYPSANEYAHKLYDTPQTVVLGNTPIALTVDIPAITDGDVLYAKFKVLGDGPIAAKATVTACFQP